MDSPTLPESERRLRRSDYLLLLSLCTFLYGFSLIHPRLMDAHEAVHCLNVREMLDSGDYLIATYGGRPWLERPPAPHWMTAVGVVLAGDAAPERAYRIGSIVIATLAVLVFGWAVAGCMGRSLGVISAAMLATMREFVCYAVAPECDIFLASTATIAGSLLMRALFDPQRRETRTSFFGPRSWPVVGFFVLVGAINAMKGPLFGLFFTLLPLGAFWAWDRKAERIRPLVWFWGWLLMITIGGAWPLAAYLRYPDVVELWAMDYGVRWKAGYIGEPFWYYAVQQPWNVFPWTIPAFVGLAATARDAWRGQPALRFIWCWAIVPVCFFSLFKGKHHHYMLPCLAPTAVLAAIGAKHVWAWLQAKANVRLGMAVVFLLAGLPGAILAYVFRSKIPGPNGIWIFWAIMWPLVVCAYWWAATRPRWPFAISACIVLTAIVSNMCYEYRTTCMDDYREDLNLLGRVRTVVPPDRDLYVLGEFDPLNASWQLLYLNGRGKLLHNESFLCDSRITTPDVYVIARSRDEYKLASYGTPIVIEQSLCTRRDKPTVNRYTLYRVVLNADLPKLPGDIRISPNQATGRELGPYLGPPPFYAANSPVY